MNGISEVVACSLCFRDQGLRLDAYASGIESPAACPVCGSHEGRKLTADLLGRLAHRYFVWGSLARTTFGAAPRIQFNEQQKTSVRVPEWLQADIRLLETVLKMGFFRYGPRLWMVGEIEPLKALRIASSRGSIIARILGEYPAWILRADDLFYRVRKGPAMPGRRDEYDTPPSGKQGTGRLDSTDLPVMYASPDLQVCIHECRVAAEDELYVATITPTSSLRLLNLSTLLMHESGDEFESLDMAVHMLFLAGPHSYPISREICRAARVAGYDGLIYPSYFSLLRVGAMPFETTYGISHRRLPPMQQHEAAKAIPNLALFGRPLAEGRVDVRCIDRVILNRVEYGVHYGPVGFE